MFLDKHSLLLFFNENRQLKLCEISMDTRKYIEHSLHSH